MKKEKLLINLIIFLLLTGIVYASQYTQTIRNLPPISEEGITGKKSIFSMKPLAFTGSNEDCACIKTYECKPRKDKTIRRDCYSSGGKCYCYSSPAGDTSECSYHENACGNTNLPDCGVDAPDYGSQMCLPSYKNCVSGSATGYKVSGYYCPDNYDCCRKCGQHKSYKCYNGDVWWYDGCGNKEIRKEPCDDGCKNNQCVMCENDADCGENKCVGEVAYSYKCVSGDCEAQAANCGGGTVCEDGVCETGGCDEEPIGDLYCDGKNVVQMMQYSNCQKSGETVEECDYECSDGECIDAPPECNCPENSVWSNCKDGVKSRPVYKCGLSTNYACIQDEETASCGINEICTNGIDDDNDGSLDCDDSDCISAAACEEPLPTCGDGKVHSSENCANCPADIKCKGELVCDEYDGKCKEVPGMPIIPIMIVSLVIIIVAGILLYMKVSKGK